jgi:hypothetical protein
LVQPIGYAVAELVGPLEEAMLSARSISIFAILLAACGGTPSTARSGTPSNGGTPPAGEMSSGGFTLSVTSAQWEAALQNERPPSGRTYAELNISLSNNSASPILASAPLFSVLTTSSIEVPTSPATGLADSPCTDLSVAKGGTLACSLVFEVPTGDTPAELVYDDHMGHSAKAPIAIVTVDACSRFRGWTRLNTSECVSCFGSSGCPKETACTSSELNCVEADGAGDPCSTVTTCGLSQMCADQLKAALQCQVAACDASCS